MTLDELVNDKMWRDTVRMLNIVKLYSNKERIFCHYKQCILNTSTKLFTLSKHTKNKITIYDYTSLSQDEIHNLIDAKIKYDFRYYNYNKYSKIYRNIISEDNKNIKKYDLSQITPDFLHEIISKNEVFIANLNSLYSSNKILAELDAL